MKRYSQRTKYPEEWQVSGRHGLAQTADLGAYQTFPNLSAQ